MIHILVVAHGWYDAEELPNKIQLQDHQYVRFYSGPGAIIDGPAADMMASLILQDPDNTTWHTKLKGRFLFGEGYSQEIKDESSSLKRLENSAKVDLDATRRFPKTYNPSNGLLNILLGPTSKKQIRNYQYSLNKREDDEKSFKPRVIAITKFQFVSGNNSIINVVSRPMGTLPQRGTLADIIRTCNQLFGQQPFMIHWVACTEVDADEEALPGFKYVNYVWEMK